MLTLVTNPHFAFRLNGEFETMQQKTVCGRNRHSIGGETQKSQMNVGGIPGSRGWLLDILIAVS